MGKPSDSPDVVVGYGIAGTATKVATREGERISPWLTGEWLVEVAESASETDSVPAR